MTPATMAKTEKADIQFQNPTPTVESIVGDESQANVAVSRSLPYSAVKHAIVSSRPPQRPNRNRPIHGSNLTAEFEAWDAASDESLENTERDLTE